MYRASIIKTIQYGTITVGSGNASATATITAVDAANAVVVPMGFKTLGAAYGSAEIELLRVALTNATTVTATRVNTATASGQLRFVVVEFIPGVVKSIQTGTIAISGTSNTATISTISTTKTWLVHQGQSLSDASGNWSDSYGDLTQTNATTITATRQTSGAGTLTVGYAAVEFK